MKFLPLRAAGMNSSTRATVRLYTATRKPLLSMFSAKFSPITASPMRPMSASGCVMVRANLCGDDSSCDA